MSHGKQGQKQMKLMAAGDILATWVVNSHWKIYLSCNAKKTAFCIILCETEAVIAKLISAFDFALTPKSMPPAITCCCTARFVSDLVGNTEGRFSHDMAHLFFPPPYVVYCCTNSMSVKKKICFYLMSAQNLDCRYLPEQPKLGGFNMYNQCFRAEIR